VKVINVKVAVHEMGYGQFLMLNRPYVSIKQKLLSTGVLHTCIYSTSTTSYVVVVALSA